MLNDNLIVDLLSHKYFVTLLITLYDGVKVVWSFLARVVGFPIGRRSGGRLSTTLMGTFWGLISFFVHSLFFSPPSFTFLRSKTYFGKADGNTGTPRG